MIQLIKGCVCFLSCCLLSIGRSILLFSPLQWLWSQHDVASSNFWYLRLCKYTPTDINFITPMWALTVAYFLQAGLWYPMLSCISLSHSDVSLAQYFTVFSAGFVCTQYCWGQRWSEVVKQRFKDLILHIPLTLYGLICTSWQPRPVSLHSAHCLLLLVEVVIYRVFDYRMRENGHKDDGCWASILCLFNQLKW